MLFKCERKNNADATVANHPPSIIEHLSSFSSKPNLISDSFLSNLLHCIREGRNQGKLYDVQNFNQDQLGKRNPSTKLSAV